MIEKTILLTGATDGIGLETAKVLAKPQVNLLIHGRNKDKLEKAIAILKSLNPDCNVISYQADLSSLTEVNALANKVLENHPALDVLINNAGVFVTQDTRSIDHFDTRFAVNTIAPYLLTKKLLGIMPKNGRVVNLSSAAQTSVTPAELLSTSVLSDNAVYAKSKLALTMWSFDLAKSLDNKGPVIVAINPKSFLGSKMVEQAYGVKGGDLQIGADILVRAALSEEFSQANGRYFDNDIGQFSSPHQDALNPQKTQAITVQLDEIIEPFV